MNQVQSVIDSERAAVERWFPRGPMGRLFDPGDGHMLPIREDTIPEWRDQAYAMIDAFVFDSKRWHVEGVLVVIATAVASFAAARWLHSGAAGGVTLALGMAVLHILGLFRLRRYRRALADLRARIRSSLAASAPLPPEFGARFRLANPWRTALHAWVAAILVASGAAAHFLSPDQMPPMLVLAIAAAVGIAWLLYFQAQRTDREQQAAR